MIQCITQGHHKSALFSTLDFFFFFSPPMGLHQDKLFTVLFSSTVALSSLEELRASVEKDYTSSMCYKVVFFPVAPQTEAGPSRYNLSSTLSAIRFSDIILAAVSARVIHYFSYLLCSNSHCPVNIRLEYWKFLPFKLESI